MVNALSAHCAIDSGSGITLLSRQFVANHRIPTSEWGGPLVAVADGKLLGIKEACLVNIALLRVTIQAFAAS